MPSARPDETREQRGREPEPDDDVASSLQEHAPHDQRLASHAIGQRSGEYLSNAPDDRVDRFDETDAFKGNAIYLTRLCQLDGMLQIG
jgi:hypothetical protein